MGRDSSTAGVRRARAAHAKRPRFFYDINSPYSYLAAMRVDDVLPVAPLWRPVAFGVIVQRLRKVPWSFAAERRAHFREIDRRATQRGMPPLRYPPGWPRRTYSLAPLRAALVADDAGRLREVSRELFRAMFVQGQSFADLETTLDAVERAGLDREEVRAAIRRHDVKHRLCALTEEALEMGVTGVPTVAIGGELFWGDDELEAAAETLTAQAHSWGDGGGKLGRDGRRS